MPATQSQSWTETAEAAALLTKAATAAIDGKLKRYADVRTKLFIMRDGRAATGSPSLSDAIRDAMERVLAERAAAEMRDAA